MVFVLEGLQWGDEGKGKITDYLGQNMDIVVRHQGGNNAGHTVVINDKHYALSCLPSGIINPKVTNVIAQGCIVNIDALLKEIETLKTQGINDFKLFISNRAHIIMPYHIDLDGAYEKLLKNNKIGTTKKGIGPCYKDKFQRIGIRFGDLLEEDYLKERLNQIIPLKNIELESVDKKPYEIPYIFNYLMSFKDKIKDYIIDTGLFLRNSVKENKNILCEGAQGAMLCIDNGTYPFVTSSSPLSNSVPLNTSIPSKDINKVIGIMKAYTTRVGEGPFVTEIHNEIADEIRERGHEYGTVTHRPRRIGNLDLVVVKTNINISGVNYISLMLLDVLSSLKEINVCVNYSLDDKVFNDYIPSTIAELERVKPIYKTFKGWEKDITNIKKYSDLPSETKEFVEFIEEFTNTKVAFISVGAEREQTIIKEDIFK